MDLRKLLFLEHFSTVYKRRVVSGLGLAVVASLLVFSLLISLGGNNSAVTTVSSSSSSSSVFSWFFTISETTSDAELQRSTDFALGNEGEGVVEKTIEVERNVEKTIEVERNVDKTHVEKPVENATEQGEIKTGWGIFEKTHNNKLIGREGNVSLWNITGDVMKPPEGNLSRSSTDSRNTSGSEWVSRANLTEEFSGGDINGSILQGANSSGNSPNVAVSKNGGNEERTYKANGLNHKKNKSLGRSSEVREPQDIFGSSDSTKSLAGHSGKCDIFSGGWVRDEGKPYYPAGSCPLIDVDFDCHKNGRPDDGYLRWRWQPNGCNIPSLNATDFLERLRGQRLIFVGDSLNRNMWESLVCILRHSVKNKSRVYEISGRREFKTKGYYAFRFEEYECSVDFVRSPFLVRESYANGVSGLENEKLRLDVLDETTLAYHKADIVVFNTGHWWTHEKTSKGKDYYQEGNYVYPVLKVMKAYKKALTTWARWVDKNIDPKKTQVVFRGYSLTHFRGGQWNSGGQCHKETEPIFNETFLAKYPGKMRTLEQVLKQMKTPVIYLNISRITDYRKDGHPSIYRKEYKTVKEQINAEKSQDCSHWCLPGIPDTWNDLLYASLLMEGKGSWRAK